MARIHGRRGRLYCELVTAGSAEPVVNLNAWTAAFTVAQADVTAFGDTNMVYVAGFADAKGTFAGFYDTVSPQLYTAASDGLARKFYLYPDTTDGDYWFGTGLFDFSVAGSTTTAVTVTGNWSAASSIILVKS